MKELPVPVGLQENSRRTTLLLPKLFRIVEKSTVPVGFVTSIIPLNTFDDLPVPLILLLAPFALFVPFDNARPRVVDFQIHLCARTLALTLVHGSTLSLRSGFLTFLVQRGIAFCSTLLV